MKKRLLAPISLILIAVFLFASCQAPAEPAPAAEEAAEAPAAEAPAAEESAGEPERYVLVTFSAGHESWNQMIQGGRDVIKNLGLNATFEGPQGPADWDAPAELVVLDQVAATMPDGIVITSGDEKTLVPGVERAVEAGITVECLDLKAETPLCNFVGTSFVQMGEVAATRIIELCQEDVAAKGTCQFASTEIAGVQAEELRKQGFDNILKDHPEIEWVANVDDKAVPETTVTVVGQILAANPDVRVLTCLHGQGAQAMATAVKNAGLVPNKDVFIVGNDLGSTTLECIEAGECDSTVGQDMYMMGGYAFLNLWMKKHQILENTIIEGKYGAPYINPGTDLITIDNIGSLLERVEIIQEMYK